MKEWLKKLWIDSVWSKVIAALLLPYFVALVAAVKGFLSEKRYIGQVHDIQCIDIPLWTVPFIIVAVTGSCSLVPRWL